VDTSTAVIIGLASFFVLLGLGALRSLINKEEHRRWRRFRIGVFVEREESPEKPPEGEE
jgi:hypothetical protein